MSVDRKKPRPVMEAAELLERWKKEEKPKGPMLSRSPLLWIATQRHRMVTMFDDKPKDGAAPPIQYAERKKS